MPDPVDELYGRLKEAAEKRGYHLNPDVEFTKGLLAGLLRNQDRYGYQACPCRLASGRKDDDLDIVCPCDYRDRDLSDHGMCYCGLYVNEGVATGEGAHSIPDRRRAVRTAAAGGAKPAPGPVPGGTPHLSVPVYRCRVCGYLCAREHPPEVCPICGAKKERFERFIP